MVVGKQRGECNFCGEQGASVCFLRIETWSFLLLFSFFSRVTSVTRLFGSV